MRFNTRLAGYSADSPQIRRFLARVGAEIVDRARANMVSQRIGDTGRLRASLAFRIEEGSAGAGATLVAGAFNVKYAAIHEFGMHYTPQMIRAMFASLHARGLLGRPSKGVMIAGTLPPRPYLVPAFREATRELPAKLRDFLRLEAATNG